MAPGIQRLIPEGTTSLAGVRLGALLKTEIYQRLAASRVSSQLEQFTSATGVDPNKDISEFAVALANGQPLLLVEGRFDAAAIEKRFGDRGVAAVEIDGFKTWSAGPEASFALASRSSALLGPSALVKSALAGKGLPPPLAPLLPEVASGAQIWGMSSADFKNFRAPERSNLQNLEKMIGGVDSIVASADLRFGVQFRATGFCSSPEDAVKLQTAIRGGMGLVRLSAPPEALDAVKALDTVIVKPEGKLLRFAIDMTGEQIDLLQRVLPAIGR